MDRTTAIEDLKGFKLRLQGDVSAAYANRGADFGRQRFAAWRRQFSKYLEENLPGSRLELDKVLTHSAYWRSDYESDHDVFMREDGEPCLAFIDSLCLDIENGEYDFANQSSQAPPPSQVEAMTPRSHDKVFIVHGHDETLKLKTARFIEKLGLKAIILHEQASRGQTIIEKIESNTDVDFAIVLYSPDDAGNTKAAADAGNLQARARQNVVFEHGYLLAKLSRSHVISLVSRGIEMPSDVSGVVYVDDANWQIDIAKEMKAAGYTIDFNKILDT